MCPLSDHTPWVLSPRLYCNAVKPGMPPAEAIEGRMRAAANETCLMT